MIRTLDLWVCVVTRAVTAMLHRPKLSAQMLFKVWVSMKCFIHIDFSLTLLQLPGTQTPLLSVMLPVSVLSYLP